MIKHIGNLEKAKLELKNNSATSYIYDDSKINEGNLSGAVITLKDLFATKDAKTQGSSKILEGFTPGYDSTVVKKLKENGASIVAKVHMDELALGGTGQYNAYGKIESLVDPTRMVGGSSSGSIATLTENISLSIGSDTGDSVRLPASYNGKYGFKPSYGAISRYGVFAYASSLDTVGLIGHNIDDIVLTSSYLYGKDELDMTSKEVDKPVNEKVKPKKIGFIKNDGFLEYQIEEYKKLKATFENDGIEVEEFEIDNKLLESIDIVYQVISFSEASSNDSNLNGISFGPGSKGNNWSEIMENSRTNLIGEYAQRRFTLGAYFLFDENISETFYKAQRVRRLIVNEFNKIKEQVDVLVYPATPIAPKLTDEKKDIWCNSILISENFSGAPSLVIPWSKHDDMPFGLSINGLLYSDNKTLSFGKYIDDLLGGSNE